ncbi:MAG TPA: neutral zinc metallopeptidase [Dehalococcoidia bacterium]|nr:neutral zinc metallopeptidase [Dehalococcoidia bacterium]
MKPLLVSLLVSLTVAGCGPLSGESTASPSAAATPSRSDTRTSTGTGSETRCPKGSLEGCYSYSQMSSYLDTIEPLVAKFFQTQYTKLANPRDVVFVPTREARRSVCGGYSDSFAYEYCPASRTIYIGQDLLWSFYRRQGDAAPVVALAHEWGHHVQSMLGVPFAGTNAESVRYENQADCIAGAFVQYAGGQGWLESDDLGDVDGLLQAVGSREGRARDHGTAAERKQAFDLGFKSGAKGCNSYYPSTPVG